MAPRFILTRRKPWLIFSVGLAAVMVGVISWTTVSPFSLAGADAVLLSQGKPATASSVEGAHFSASAAVDGDGASRWSSAAADPQWLRVDLGGEYALTQVVLQWQSAYATAFQIQVSHDDASWATAYSTTESHGGTQTLQVTATARYVRVLGTARATAYGYSFWEFQVFGSAPAAGSASPPTTPTAGGTSSSPGTGPAGTGTVKLSTPVQPIVSTGKPPRAGFQEIHANCGVTNHLSDDPIVFPGLAGASHNHTFVGSTMTNASSTPASLLTGGTSCQDVQDKSAYWFPTLYQHGQVVDPSTVTIYYKSGVTDYRTVQPFPAGFRFVVGSSKTPDAAHFRGNWQCGNQGQFNDFLPSCPAGSALVVHLKAPSCWDAVTLDDPTHAAYMVYPINGVCPADHPVALPMLEIKVSYQLPGGHTDGLAYSSGGSYTFHYDFMNGWVPSRLAYLTKHCINEARQCNGFGIDQHKP